MKGGEGGKIKKKIKRKGKGGRKIRKSETEAMPRPLAGKAGEGGEEREKEVPASSAPPSRTDF